jgi:hypothetical protein
MEEGAVILVVCSSGHVLAAVNDALEGLDETSREYAAGEDLLERARGCRAVVYAPEPRLLDAYGVATPDSEQMLEVLRVTRVPGVERLVVVVPSDAPWDDEERLIRRVGRSCVVVRCAPLVDELADATNLHTARPVWLERGSDVELASRPALTCALRSALLFEALRGTTSTVPAVRMDIGEAMQRAAAVAGASVKIHVAGPGISLSMRRLYAWLGVASLEVEALCDRLVRRRRPAMA